MNSGCWGREEKGDAVLFCDEILTLGDDDDDDSGNEDHAINEYASRRFTYYTVDVKTENS